MLVAIHDRSSDNQGTTNQSFAEHTLYLEGHQIQITTANNPVHDSNGRRQRTLQVNLMAFSFSKIPLLTYFKLFAIHYGLTFCLFMCTLYDTSLGPTLFFQTYTIRQLDLMPKSWNELLRHRRSGFIIALFCCVAFISILFSQIFSRPMCLRLLYLRCLHIP